MESLKKINLSLGLPLRGLIWIYQCTISPDHGMFRSWYPHGYCRFYPTCSQYADAVLAREGLRGLPKIIIRVLRCNPFVAPAIDHPKI